MLTIYILIIALNLLCFLFKMNNKIVILISFVLVWMLVGGNILSADVSNYTSLYTIAPTKGLSLEYGYTLLEKLGNSLGLEYPVFRLIFAIPPVVLLYYFVKMNIGTNAHLFIIFYLSYLVIMDAEQIRNFSAVTIILFSTLFYLDESKSKKYRIYSLLIAFLLAFTLHVTIIFYILFLIYYSKNNKFWTVFFLFNTFLIVVILLFNNNQIPYMENFINDIDDWRLKKYLSSTTNFGFLVPIILSVFNTIWAFCLADKKELFSNKEKNFLEFTLFINIVSFVFTPVYMMNINFYRLVRNLLYFNLVSLQLNVNSNEIGFSRKMFLITISIIINMSWFVYDFILTDHVDNVLIPILTKNFFFN